MTTELTAVPGDITKFAVCGMSSISRVLHMSDGEAGCQCSQAAEH